ncbi:MAG TPA: thiamine phosphate synthase [Terriglobales bacterium]
MLDASCFASSGDLFEAAQELIAAGCNLVQYRNKRGSPRQILGDSRQLKRLLGGAARVIVNDRPDAALLAGCDGVHVGQDDLSAGEARRVAGEELWVGISTHNPEQVQRAAQAAVDYVAIGPVFATASKANPDPVIGLEGIRKARALTGKPLVAIGGITRANCRAVIDAGADSVAVISDLIHNPQKTAEEFLRILR